MIRTFSIFLALLTLAFTLPIHAQRGDRKGHEMKEVWRDMDVPEAPIYSPQKALETMKMADGFRVELIAAEPLIEDPVALAYDADGRIWVVEMRGYMPNVDGKGETELKTGRVSVLEDLDGDGKMDKATRFLDGLILPRAITIVKGGVLIGEPPNLWFCEDTNGDLKCDKKTKVASYGRLGPVEHTDNGLAYGLDNWLYNAKSSRRFQFHDGEIIEDKTVSRGQWGIATDDWGRLYYNSNSSYLHADLVPPEYLIRHPHYKARNGIGSRIVGDQSTWTIRVNPGINRGYQSNMLRKDGRLARTTAISGVAIYRGDRYPEKYQGMAIVPEPSGNIVAAFHLQNDGVNIKTEQITQEDKKWGKRAFMASPDERFRPVSAYSAPDGTIHVVDMYRGILQHKVFVTTFLRKQIIERKLDKPIGMGRIYRIVHESQKPATLPKMSNFTSAELVTQLTHPNGWRRDTAQRLLVERNDQAIVSQLHQLAAESENPKAKIHALWTLHGMNAIDKDTIRTALNSNHPQVLIHAMRTGEHFVTNNDKSKSGIHSAIYNAAKDTSLPVKLQAIYSLAEGNTSSTPLLEHMLTIAGVDISNAYIRDAILSGLNTHELNALTTFINARNNKDSNSSVKGIDSLLKELGRMILTARDQKQITELLESLNTHLKTSPEMVTTVLDGIFSTAGKKGPKPVKLDKAPSLITTLLKSDEPKLKAAGEKLKTFLTYPGGMLAKNNEPRPLTEDEKKLYEIGKGFYSITCMACHQTHGGGQLGMAPTLIETDWVNGSEERLVRIILQGMQGPVTIDDQEWNLVMPPHGVNPILNDERIAGILTYIRRSWGNEADPVKPETVTRIRNATKDRQLPWTAKELLELKP